MGQEEVEHQRGVVTPPWIFGALLREAITIARVLWISRTRAALIWLSIGLVAVIGATAYGQIELNAWNKPFYDALARRDLDGFVHQLGVFSVIAVVLLGLNVFQTWLNQMLRVTLRSGLTRDLFSQWLAPRRAFLLAGAGDIGVNPDQRIQQDARHLADLSTDLGVGMLQAVLLLASFIGVLWGLSAGVIFHVASRDFAIPGYMVWSALFYSAAASLAGWVVGRRLISLDAEHYARESDLRSALVHVNEHKEGISVYHGEVEEEEKLNLIFDRLLVVLRQLVRATTNLTWVTAGYGWFTIVAPIIVAAPAFFAGNLSFGGLLMSAGAFTQVQQSLRWVVDNAGAIADWRATLHRVGAFRIALLELDKTGETRSRITVETTANARLVLENLKVFLPSGSIGLSEPRVEVEPGQRILIVAAAGSGKTCLFRAIAGLWPWGAGRIGLPAGDRVMFMPQRPFIPDGAIDRILAYPDPPETFTEAQLVSTLTRMRLGHLAPRLRRLASSDQELSYDEQLALVFARLLLRKPDCVVVDEALEALTPETRELVFDILAKELAATSLLAIDGPRAETAPYDRVFHLVFDPEDPGLARSDESRKGA